MTMTSATELRSIATPANPVRSVAGQPSHGTGSTHGRTTATGFKPGAEIQTFVNPYHTPKPVLCTRTLDRVAQAEWPAQVVSSA